jgi:hypothetical protein
METAMLSIRQPTRCSIVCAVLAAATASRVASADEAFPKHVQTAFEAFDDAARLIARQRYDEAVAALEGFGKSLPPPYSDKATAAADQLKKTVVEPRFDDRSSFLRGKRLTRAAEVCLVLHAYPEAADIFQDAARDSAMTIGTEAKIEVVRRAYRHAQSDAVRYRDLFTRCQAVDEKIYSRADFENDELSAGRRSRGGLISELVEELPAELTVLGLKEFHWLRLRKLHDDWPEPPAERKQALALADESIAAICDSLIAADAPTTAPREPAASDRDAAANIERLLELGRIDAAASLCREFIPVARHPETCFTAVLAVIERLTETERFDGALDLARRLVSTPQFAAYSEVKHQAVVAAYHTCVRRGDPRQALLWAEMAVGPFCRRSGGCGNSTAAFRRADAYLIAEARLRADPSDAVVEQGLDVLATYGRFYGSIGPLIAAEHARRGTLEALEQRVNRLAELEAAGKLSQANDLLDGCPSLSIEVIPGMRLQIELQHIRTAGHWDGLWNRLVEGGRRVHQALGPTDGPPDGAASVPSDKLARQAAALLLDRPNETPKKLRQVRNVDDVKLGWKLYFAAALAREDAAHGIRARLDTIAAAPDANLRANYLDCLTAMAALPEKERTALAGETRSARVRVEKKLADEPGSRPVLAEGMQTVRRPRYLEE